MLPWSRLLFFFLLLISTQVRGGAEVFIAPFSGNLYIKCVGGDSPAPSQFGTGTSPANFTPYLTGLPANPSPSGEVFVRSVNSGETVVFGISTVWGGETKWAFSNGTDPARADAFSDLDNSLHLGGRIMEQTGPNTWVMHLDDAFSSDDDDNDLLIEVRLVATQPVGPPALSVQGPLSFTCLSGSNPSPQQLTVSGNTVIVFTASASSSGNWLAVNPNNGVAPTIVTVSVNALGLAPGTYSGSIAVSSATATNSPQVVQVTLTVQDGYLLSASPTSLAFTYQLGGSQPSGKTIAFSSLRSGLAFSAMASGAAWLSVSPATASTPATLNIGVSPAGLTQGTYNGQITITSSSASNPIQYLPVTLTVLPPVPPVFTSAGIVNAASYATGLVPGGLATLFGKGLSIVSGSVLGGGRTSVNGTSVSVGGIPAPLISVVNVSGQEQISFQVPFELQGITPATVQVTNNGTPATISGFPVLATQPGIFEVPINTQGARTAAAIHQNGQLVSPGNPAQQGEYVSLFLTGAGPLEPWVPTGALGPVPPAVTSLPVSVAVGDVGCNVVFSGYAPGAIGLYQINFQIPFGAPAGPSVKLSVTVGSASSPLSSIPVN